jgi:hypothetical protein
LIKFISKNVITQQYSIVNNNLLLFLEFKDYFAITHLGFGFIRRLFSSTVIPATSFVIPAKAGIQNQRRRRLIISWIPAFAGMTMTIISWIPDQVWDDGGGGSQIKSGMTAGADPRSSLG